MMHKLVKLLQSVDGKLQQEGEVSHLLVGDVSPLYQGLLYISGLTVMGLQ